MKKWIIGVIVLCLVFFVGSTLYNTYKESKEKESVQLSKNVQATDFTLPLLSGEEVTLQEYQGKIIILNFWASWCEPCNKEAPHLQNFYKKHKRDVEILAINVTTKDNRTDVEKFVEKYHLTFPVLLDESGDTSTMYGAFSFPTTIIIDREGTINQEILGPLNDDLLDNLIKTL